jgi:type III restriction enzyme
VSNPFFDQPILNSPYEYPSQHWELDEQGQPTQRIVEHRRRAEFVTPIPKPKKRKGEQRGLAWDDGTGLSTEHQQYEETAANINELRHYVDQWRLLPRPSDWLVTPRTARLLQHWWHCNFNDVRPFFCQIEAVEVAIWLTEVTPKLGKVGKKFEPYLKDANREANPELMRLALKLSVGTASVDLAFERYAETAALNILRRTGDLEVIALK